MKSFLPLLERCGFSFKWPNLASKVRGTPYFCQEIWPLSWLLLAEVALSSHQIWPLKRPKGLERLPGRQVAAASPKRCAAVRARGCAEVDEVDEVEVKVEVARSMKLKVRLPGRVAGTAMLEVESSVARPAWRPGSGSSAGAAAAAAYRLSFLIRLVAATA